MTLKLCVIGYPIRQSKSPIIHRYWMQKYKIEGTHEAVEINPDNFEKGIKRLVEEGYRGFNVTVPHKERIIPLCSDIDDTARTIGAVNTVTIEDGKLYGSNTDAYGFIQNLQNSAGDLDKDRKVIVLGAGGAARAVVYALKKDGFTNVVITNRTKTRADALAKEFSIDVCPWDDRELELQNTGLLVNTTSLGMVGEPELEIDLSNLSQDAIVYDIVYKPLMTNLLKNAKNNQNQIVTGIGMLLYQAVPAFEKWTGRSPSIDPTLAELILE